MKALVKARPEPGLWLAEVAEPELGINDVLVRIDRTGICGTDPSIFNWDAWARETIPVPMVVGHEFVGEVVETSSNVSDFQPGAIVSGEGHVVCGTCRNCLAGRRHLCADTRGIGVNRPGAFAEYLMLPMTNVWHHAPGVDPDVASIFDPFGNAVHTALSFPVLGEDVLITGAGPIGATAVAVARHASGGYTSARQEIVDLLRQRSRPYLFSNSLAPAIVVASIRAIELLAADTELRDRLQANTRFFRAQIAEAGFEVLPGEHPIVPIMLGDAALANRFADRMLEKGIYVVGFSYPVVPRGKARIRTQISAAHTRKDLGLAVERFTETKAELGA